MPAPAAEAVATRFVEAAGLRWCVQSAGQGTETMLLVHGTGASMHSFDALTPWLGEHFSLTAIDLPGHGQSGRGARSQLSLPGMAGAIGELLRVLGLQPAVAVGHSAGAALLVRMALDGFIAPRAIVAINGAFLPFGGLAAPLFSPLARVLHAQPWVPRLFARRAADVAVVRRLIEGTGSRLDDDGIRAYQRLMQRPGQAEGALAMMAHWDLRDLERDLPRLQTPLQLIVGALDRAVPAAQAQRVAGLCPKASVTRIDGVGHLAHEENPAAVARCLQPLSSTGGPAAEARV